MPPTAVHPALTLFGALLAVALLALLARWIFGSGRVAPVRRRARPVAPPADYGLLVPVATVPTREDAEMLCEVLAGHGIRCTVAPAVDTPAAAHGPDPQQVLVFPADVGRARVVVGIR